MLGIVAAVAFATGSRAGLIAGAVLLQIAFTTDCVDGQLARYTRQFSALGAWLDSVFDRAKEYIVFAGLAIGSTQAGESVWILAAAALALQTFRHQIDFAYTASRQRQLVTRAQPPLEQPSDMLLRRGAKAPSRADEDDLRAKPAAAPAGRAAALAAPPAAPVELHRGDPRHRVDPQDHRLPHRRALRRDLAHRRDRVGAPDLHRAADLGRVRRRVHPDRPHHPLAGMTVPTQRPDWRTALYVYRDDGPLARALGRLVRSRVPAELPLLLGAVAAARR